MQSVLKHLMLNYLIENKNLCAYKMENSSTKCLICSAQVVVRNFHFIKVDSVMLHMYETATSGNDI